ncbi:PHP domain-containing protein [Fervidicoccus fontis]|uniref:PHP C-terminal domain protein n=2 Tax=Fervidicoccus fontis TaxID=683846 RepID=I0A306_FERFK|nr:PHP domain-containing protein [Fervidicoccus fontis]AFH43363.1 PHP C-terminal domain protein [Fervidicoccus fontis Kam940]MBE9390740.1 PHP domain-containing protein [Fervidicoccus fontis]
MERVRLSVDMHMHSNFSDGESDVESILLHAERIGLNAVSITDHNTFQGSFHASKVAKEKGIGIHVVMGSEVRTDVGDTLVYCREPIEIRKGMPFLELYDRARENSCFLAFAHPFDIFRNGISMGDLHRLWEKIDAIECFNSNSLFLTNSKAYRFAREHSIPCMASSDAHTLKNIGIFRMIVSLESSEDLYYSLFSSIKVGRVELIHRRVPISVRVDKLRWSIKRKLNMQ